LLRFQVDDELAELFLNEEPITPEILKAAIRRATLALKFQPVFMGSAFKNKGKALYLTLMELQSIEPLLPAVQALLLLHLS
jgi:translation elongation factor EF-G